MPAPFVPKRRSNVPQLFPQIDIHTHIQSLQQPKLISPSTTVLNNDDNSSNNSNGTTFREGKDTNPFNTAQSDKQSLCLELLKHGHVNSYVDFFYLTHSSETENLLSEKQSDIHSANSSPPTASVDKPRTNSFTPFFLKSSTSTASLPVIIPPASYSSIALHLSQAEEAHRHGDNETLFNSSFYLNTLFASLSDWKTSLYFLEKCLDVAENSEDIEKKLKCCENLGEGYEKTGEYRTAVAFYELAVTLAEEKAKELQQFDGQDGSIPSTERNHITLSWDGVSKANAALVNAYCNYAANLQSTEDYSNALTYAQKALWTSKKQHNRELEANCNYFCGILHTQVIPPHLQILQPNETNLLSPSRFVSPPLSPSSSAALISSSMPDYSASITHFQSYVQYCREVNDFVGQTRGYFQLARCFSKCRQFKLARQYYEKLSQIAVENSLYFTQANALLEMGEISSLEHDNIATLNVLERAWKALNLYEDNITESKENIKVSKDELEIARIKVGMARGQAVWKDFAQLAKDNSVEALYAWKAQRTPFNVSS